MSERILDEGFNVLKQCRYGPLVFNKNDMYVGKSLDLYGEFSQGEAALFEQIVQPGFYVVEVGANIGAHTVHLAKLVGPTGRVYAFEPQRLVFQTLCANLAINQVVNVHSHQWAVGSIAGDIEVPEVPPELTFNFGGVSLCNNNVAEMNAVEVVPLDDLQLPNCNLLKIDVEGMEIEVLKGASTLIANHRPVIFVENDRVEKSADLIKQLGSQGYDCWWHVTWLYSDSNFYNHSENVFPGLVSINMLCFPTEFGIKVDGLDRVEEGETSRMYLEKLSNR